MIKTILAVSAIGLFMAVALANTTLTLTWEKPAGFSSRLYYKTNIMDAWQDLGEQSPPVDVEATNQQMFFQVIVLNTNYVNDFVTYTTDDPNILGLKPIYTNKPALAYDPNGLLGMYGWNTNNQQWQ